MSIKKNQYVCNVGSDERPLDLPKMDFTNKGEQSLEGQSDASQKSQDEEPLGIPTMTFRKDAK